MDEIMDEIEEFARRCANLEAIFQVALTLENSDRVWISVMVRLLVKICKHQADSQGAYDQVVRVMSEAFHAYD